MKSILLIIPYFGKIPSFYETWKVTALANSTIDFLLFTDDESVRSEGNIRVEHMQWEDLVSRVQSAFSFPVRLDSPYKLCDFKPSYGVVFQSYIHNYDFWGYCDIDLLFGNIRSFFTDEVLSEYDKCCYLGHLSIYRNCERMNRLYTFQEDGGYPAVNYQECFSSPNPFYFDEYCGMYAKCLINGIRVFNPDERRDPIVGERAFFWRNKAPESQYVVYWQDNQLYAVHRNERVNLLYAHFFRRTFETPAKPDAVRSILITPGAVAYNTEVTADAFEKKEPKGYKLSYTWKTLKSSVRKMGIRQTIAKRKFNRDYHRYRQQLLQKYKQL